MPGLKRSHERASSNGLSDTNSQPPHSESIKHRKRPRLSGRLISESSDELTDEETQHVQATQFYHLQNQKHQQENKAQDNGIIESITLTNFMCHDYLQVDIGPLVNFIIGHNGSGKSAVLTALTICLGGKASATNRAGSLKAFVKAGKESCTVSVKIKNQGDTAYQPNLYGGTIIVERSFTVSGSSGFKLKGSNGRVISTKRSDLEDITDFYALQLDNPMTVLTQDNARQFLNASSPSEKYKYFMKGVQLEQLNQDYELLQESIEQIESTFEEKETQIRALRIRKDDAEAKWSALERADTIREEINLQRVKMAWSQVRDQENVLQSQEVELEEIGSKITDFNEQVIQAGYDFDKANERHIQAQNLLQEVENSFLAEVDERKGTKDQYDSLKKEAVASLHEQRQIADRIKAAKASVSDTEKDIQDEIRRLEEINGGSLTRRLEELEIQKDEVNASQRRLYDHKAELPTLEGKLKDATSATEKQKIVLRAKRQDLQGCETRLKDLQEKGNQRNGYPPRIDDLLKAIAQTRNFTERPIGPVGDYVQLKEPNWARVLEKSLGSALNGFVVTSKADQAKLDSIMRKVNCKCPIFIGNSGSIDTSNHEPLQSFTTVLRILDISNDLVKRQLVINQGIEQTLLIEDLQEARDTMHSGRLQNVKQCFSLNPKFPGCGVRFSYGRGTNLRSDPIEAYKGLPRLKTSIEDHISFERNQYDRLRRELTDLEAQRNALQQAAEESRKAVVRHSKASDQMKVDLQRAEQKVEDLQTAIDNESVEEGRLETLKIAKKNFEEEREVAEGLYEDATLEHDRQQTALAACKRQLDAMTSNIIKVEESKKIAASKVADTSHDRQRALAAKNDAYDNENRLKEEQSRIQVSRNQTYDIVADWTAKAAGIGDRVPISENETSISIEARLEKLDEEVKLTERRAGGDRRKVAEAKLTATRVYETSLSRLKSEKELADLLKHSLQTRRERWGYFRKKIVARARCTFLHVLSERSFTGKLKVDHKTRKLEVEVVADLGVHDSANISKIQPDESQRGQSARETSTLSGGEKSYSTICLLLALWDAIGAPIRCLDEFDVFMDSVNRDRSMRLLIKWARSSFGRQFILISPQSGVVDANQDVKIIKMADPVTNGQTRLNIQTA